MPLNLIGVKGVLLLPFALQAAAMAVDEFYFHRRRGLSRWERWGHPLDTMSVLAVYAVSLMAPPVGAWPVVFIGLSALSTAFVTKDEWIHHRVCGAVEHWLHAVLFVLHPLVLLVIYILWQTRRGVSEVFHTAFLTEVADMFFILPVMAGLTLLFLIQQILYWNFSWKPS